MNLFKELYKEIKGNWKDYCDDWRKLRAVRKERRATRRFKRRVDQAKKTADLKHKADGKTYYVLLDVFDNPIAVNSLEIKAMKNNHMLPKDFDIKDLLESAQYITKRNN